MSNTGLTMVFGDTTRVSAITMTTFTGTNETIKIGSEYCYATFGRCTIRKSGNIVADLFPCLLGNEVGYYDSVNQTFLGNSGSGMSFTAYDVYGNIVCGEDEVESLKLGSENVVIMYLGENPIYASYEPPFEGLSMTTGATLLKNSGSTATINIRSSENWTLSIPVDATWLSASTMSGQSGRTAVNLETVEENTASTRTATITATTANYSATCVVTQKYFVDNFMFNYNARDYNSLTNTITRESGQLFDEDIVVHPVSADTTKLTFNGSRNQRYAKQYSSSSANPFNRSSNDSELTFIYKANFTSTGSKASNLFANRNGGYNYMVRKDGFHASQICLEVVPSEQPAIVYITVDSSGNGFKKIVTTNQTASGSVVFSQLSNAITFFDGGWITYEEFIGDFYWMFCANRKLTDAEIQAVIDYNENAPTPVPPTPTGQTTTTLTIGNFGHYYEEGDGYIIEGDGFQFTASTSNQDADGIAWLFMPSNDYNEYIEGGDTPENLNSIQYFKDMANINEGLTINEFFGVTSCSGGLVYAKACPYYEDENTGEYVYITEELVTTSGQTWNMPPTVEECWECEGTGVVDYGEGDETCPTCEGSGWVSTDCQGNTEPAPAPEE